MTETRARELVEEWLSHYDVGPRITFTHSEDLQQLITKALLAYGREREEAVRERCAEIAETLQPVGADYPARGHEIATAIRALTEKADADG